jgi:ribonuclease HII
MKNKSSPYLFEVGCDEAGRGCLAGPVTAAAVILPKNFEHTLLNDSKQVSKGNRDALRTYIEDNALYWAVGWATEKEIDQINILNASILAMHRAIEQVETQMVVAQMSEGIQKIAVDGNRFKKYKEVPHETFVKGDARFLHIAAASILAKTHRDEYMEKLHLEHPQFGWNSNAGYPTKTHREAIRLHGPTRHHRMSFQLLPRQLGLFD